jgi:hypothetical protein
MVEKLETGAQLEGFPQGVPRIPLQCCQVLRRELRQLNEIYRYLAKTRR